MAWGSTYVSSLQKVQVKQNHVARLIFFANIRGKDTESALPLLNLLDMLTVYNIYSLHVLKFAHLWHNKGLLPDVFRNTFQYASEVHSYNTRYSTQKNLYKPHFRTNTGKQMISFKANDLWKSIPQNLSNVYTFSKNIKNFLLSEQFVPVNKELSCNIPQRRSTTVSLETYPLYSKKKSPTKVIKTVRKAAKCLRQHLFGRRNYKTVVKNQGFVSVCSAVSLDKRGQTNRKTCQSFFLQ